VHPTISVRYHPRGRDRWRLDLLRRRPEGARPLPSAFIESCQDISSVHVGACGIINDESDYVVAIGHHIWDTAQTSLSPGKNPYCGKKIAATLSATGKTVTVTIVDKCAGCNDESLDFSGGAWDDIINRAAPFEGLRWHFP